MDVTMLAEALDALAPQILDVCQAPGVSIAVGVEDEVVYAKGFGLADLATGRPMDADTVGPTGSDAKPYTGVAAMQLVEAGIVDLDGPVNDHLGGLRIVNPHGDRPITLRDLLTHRSGIGTTLGFCDLVPPPPLDEHLRTVFKRGRGDAYGGDLFPLWATAVGAHHQYANTGIALVGLMVEHANPDGVAFGEWVRRRIFEPVGMTSTCFPPVQDAEHVPADIWARRSTGYAMFDGLQLPLPQIHVGDTPAGSALTTPSDHVRFMLAMANDGGAMLGADAAREMLTPQSWNGAGSTGLIWNLFETDTPDEYFGHGGELMWGWHNVARCYRHRRIAVVAGSNQFDLGDQGTSDRPSHLVGRLVLEVVSAWVRGEDPRPRRDAAAARSHLAGLVVGDRLGLRLGIPTKLTDEQIDAIAASVIVRPGTPWDPVAFAEALRQVREVDGLRASAALWRAEIQPHVRDLVARQLGVPGLAKAADLLPIDL
jgi:CubicO group peptidase (beta-lactamase class C family)